MRIKSYFTDSVQEAIERARVELGPDALLMNSKKTEAELRAMGAYEVVFGIPTEAPSHSNANTSLSAPDKPARLALEPVAEKKRVMHGTGGISKGLAALLAPAPVSAPLIPAPVLVPGAAALPSLSAAGLSRPAAPLIAPTAAGVAAAVVPVAPATVPVAAAPLAGWANSLPASTAALPAACAPAGGLASDLSRELIELREQIETVKRSMFEQARERTASAAAPLAASAEPALAPARRALEADRRSFEAERHNVEVDAASERLVSAGFSGELAREISEAVKQRLAAERGAGTQAERRASALYSELALRVKVAPGLASAAGPGRAVLFAGPAGSGKTTSLLKLALRHSLTARVPLQILSLDTLRVGGWEQLAAYARIAGLPFDVIHDPAGLGQALTEYRGKKLVLIDAPGLAPAEWRETPDLAAWIMREMARESTRETELEVQLVMPAVLRPEVALRTLERFGVLRPAKLLLTHMDEVELPGVALELAIRAGLPLSYLASGQQIPEDLEEASLERLLDHFALPPALAPVEMAPKVATAA